jgi:hypothetical protein
MRDVPVERKAKQFGAFSMSSRFTAAAKDFCFIFFRTLLAVMPVNFPGRT